MRVLGWWNVGRNDSAPGRVGGTACAMRACRRPRSWLCKYLDPEVSLEQGACSGCVWARGAGASTAAERRRWRRGRRGRPRSMPKTSASSCPGARQPLGAPAGQRAAGAPAKAPRHSPPALVSHRRPVQRRHAERLERARLAQTDCEPRSYGDDEQAPLQSGNGRVLGEDARNPTRPMRTDEGQARGRCRVAGHANGAAAGAGSKQRTGSTHYRRFHVSRGARFIFDEAIVLARPRSLLATVVKPNHQAGEACSNNDGAPGAVTAERTSPCETAANAPKPCSTRC